MARSSSAAAHTSRGSSSKRRRQRSPRTVRGSTHGGSAPSVLFRRVAASVKSPAHSGGRRGNADRRTTRESAARAEPTSSDKAPSATAATIDVPRNRSCPRHRVHDPDHAAPDGQLPRRRHPEQLPDAGALAKDEDGIALACAGRAIDGEKAVARRCSALVHGLHDEQLQSPEGLVLHGGDDGPEDLAERHANTSSTIPTTAASTGTKDASRASAASLEPTRNTRSLGPARTVSTATSTPPRGAFFSSSGWTRSSLCPASPSATTLATTVPTTRPRYKRPPPIPNSPGWGCPP